MANSVLLTTPFPLPSKPKSFHFKLTSSFTHTTTHNPFKLPTTKFPKPHQFSCKKVEAIGKTNEKSSLGIDPDQDFLVGEDSAVFELGQQKVSSWIYFGGILGVVLFVLQVGWIDNSTGLGKDFINAVSAISDSPEVIFCKTFIRAVVIY